MRASIPNVEEVAPGIWRFDLPPHEVRLLGQCARAMGKQSVVLLRKAEFERGKQTLHFAIGDAEPVNIGTSASTIGLLTENAMAPESSTTRSQSPQQRGAYGRGDREFLSLVNAELSETMAAAAKRLLDGVRLCSSGDLKRGLNRNFSETPDNFWYVIVQPRIDELSITVRGAVEHFHDMAKLEIKDDRGNTRFKIRSQEDVPAALSLIFHAVRKR